MTKDREPDRKLSVGQLLACVAAAVVVLALCATCLSRTSAPTSSSISGYETTG